ncbi:M48 family peptidase [Psychrobacter sp. FDAARGOS_221]|nr:M48 family peptidase [Psychrobacter sp. FDAARGOS_221]
MKTLAQLLAEADIELSVTRKRVKNINFRLKPNQLSVSAPHYAREEDIVFALSKRLDWAINQHGVLLKRLKRQQQIGSADESAGNNANANPLQPVTLWGKPQGLVMGEAERLRWYRHELQSVMPQLFAKWQPIVGAYANEMRIKKMKTRWGSCNTRAKRVWLSVYLSAYPIECTEYVIVHELCHLHQANHSPAFWREVKRSMPDYKHWHDMLAGKSGAVD